MIIISRLLLILLSVVTSTAYSACTIPEGILLSNGLSTIFVAKFTLFLSLLICWTIVCGQLLKELVCCPTIAGQIIGGIIIGPSGFNILRWSIFDEPLKIFDATSATFYSIASSDLYLFFVVLISSALTISYLLWIAGHEMEVRDIFHVGGIATMAGILGAVTPIAAVLICSIYFFTGYSFVQAVAIGLIFSATSVSIPVTMLVSQGKMHLKSSKATLGAAIIDDIFSIILLSMFFIALQAGTFGNFTGMLHDAHRATIGEAIIYMIISFVVIFLTGYFVIPRLLHWLESHRSSYLLSSFASCAMLAYFAFAELIGGLAGITGAFFAGLFHRMGDKHHQAEKSISPYVHAFLLPLFLGSIGLQVDISLLSYIDWYYVFILLIASIVSKLFACFVVTWAGNVWNGSGTDRWSMIESYLFGSSMVARGEVGLVISTILRGSQIITVDQYMVAVVVIILSTIASPLMLAAGFYILEVSVHQTNQEYVCNLGKFVTVGTVQMFKIIEVAVDTAKIYKTSVHISHGCEIISFEELRVKIICNPEEGIIFRGDRQKVLEIIKAVRELIKSDFNRIPESSRLP